jgi:hypothetical protein
MLSVHGVPSSTTCTLGVNFTVELYRTHTQIVDQIGEEGPLVLKKLSQTRRRILW